MGKQIKLTLEYLNQQFLAIHNKEDNIYHGYFLYDHKYIQDIMTKSILQYQSYLPKSALNNLFQNNIGNSRGAHSEIISSIVLSKIFPNITPDPKVKTPNSKHIKTPDHQLIFNGQTFNFETCTIGKSELELKELDITSQILNEFKNKKINYHVIIDKIETHNDINISGLGDYFIKHINNEMKHEPDLYSSYEFNFNGINFIYCITEKCKGSGSVIIECEPEKKTFFEERLKIKTIEKMKAYDFDFVPVLVTEPIMSNSTEKTLEYIFGEKIYYINTKTKELGAQYNKSKAIFEINKDFNNNCLGVLIILQDFIHSQKAINLRPIYFPNPNNSKSIKPLSKFYPLEQQAKSIQEILNFIDGNKMVLS